MIADNVSRPPPAAGGGSESGSPPPAVLLLYRYYDLGPLGPISSTYEPVRFGRKTVTAIAEAAALLAAVVPVTVLTRRSASTVRSEAEPQGADRPAR